MRKLSIGALVWVCLVSLAPNANATLIRYDVEVSSGLDSTPLGFLLFDATLVPNQFRNIWGSLIKWSVTWESQTFTDANSTAAFGSLFVVESNTLRVATDGEIVIPGSALQCALFGLCPYLANAPRFDRVDGASVVFSGFNSFDIPTVNNDIVDQITYTATRIANVPLAPTSWLMVLSLVLLASRRFLYSRSASSPA